MMGQFRVNCILSAKGSNIALLSPHLHGDICEACVNTVYADQKTFSAKYANIYLQAVHLCMSMIELV